jgi:hypothetical protein
MLARCQPSVSTANRRFPYGRESQCGVFPVLTRDISLASETRPSIGIVGICRALEQTWEI